MTLRTLQKRIKGSRLWVKYGFCRLYFPTSHRCGEVSVKSWFEIVNDQIEICATVSCIAGERSERWCKRESARIVRFYRKQYRELIGQCEMPAHMGAQILPSLTDDTLPVNSGTQAYLSDALTFLCGLKVAALFGDSGIGKTKVAIDVANSRYLYGKIKKVLVLCPFSDIQYVSGQIESSRPHSGLQWKVVGIEGISKGDDRFYDVLGYADRETMIILEGSELVKSPDALRSIRIRKVCSRSIYKLILSGLPVTENPGNLYMQYAMLDYRSFGNWRKFASQFLLYGGANMEEIVGYKNLDYLASLVAPYTYQIQKEAYVVLPPKTYFSLVCDLTDLQRLHYRQKKREFLERIDLDEVTPGTVLKYLTALQQIACGFRLIKGNKYEELGSLKFSLLEKLQLEGQVIFFCKYLFEADMLIEKLGREQCARFTGRNVLNRGNEKKLFIEGQKKYFVATAGSGGNHLEGLTVANTIVFFSKPYRNLMTQCVARIDRPGQRREMFIYDLKTTAGIDSMIDKSIDRKMQLEKQMTTLLYNRTKLRQYVQAL